MSASFLVVLPVIHEPSARRCLASMDFGAGNVLVVDNSTDRFAERAIEEVGKPCSLIYCSDPPPYNLGVPISWNQGAAQVINQGRDYLVLCSEAIEFGAPGGRDLIEQLPLDGQAGMEVAGAGWHLIALSRSTLQTVGLFDEWFYPGYREDTDYLYRMGLAGLPSPRENGRAMPYAYVDYTDHGTAHAIKEAGVVVNFEALKLRYIAKWGGDQGHETFTHPFNFPDRDLSWWPPIESYRDLQAHYGYVEKGPVTA